MSEASKTVEKALTDSAEGAKERSEENAYMWTKLNTDAYSQEKQKQKVHAGTVAQGMKKTGGYIGTDMDLAEKQETLLHMRTNQFEAEHLVQLKK